MTIVQQIQHWFQNDQPFISGVGLLRMTGYLQGQFESYFNAQWVPDQVEKRLEYLLTEYFNQHLDELPLPSLEEKDPTDSADASKENIVYVRRPQANEPPEIIFLREKAKLQHKLHASRFEQLKTADTDEQRHELAREIMLDIIPGLDQLYDQIRAFEQNGKIPKLLGSQDQSSGQKEKRKQSLRPRISKLKKWLEGDLDPELRQKYEKEMLAKQAELKEIVNG